MWQDVLNATLNFFKNINDFASWLFSPINFDIQHPDNEIGDFFFGWLIDLVNSIQIDIIPIQIFGIGMFVGLIVIGVFKLVF